MITRVEKNLFRLALGAVLVAAVFTAPALTYVSDAIVGVLGNRGGRVLVILPCINGKRISYQPASVSPGQMMVPYGLDQVKMSYGGFTHPGQSFLALTAGYMPCINPCPGTGLCTYPGGEVITAQNGQSVADTAVRDVAYQD